MDLIEKYLGEGDSHKYLGEQKKPKKGSMYIKWSSVFDNPANKYDTKAFMKVLKDAGAKKVWADNQFGWSNQPEVVLFTGLDERKAAKALEDAFPFFSRWGVIIHDASEDWD